MDPDADSPTHGLWTNVLRGKREGGFTWPEIAEQVSFYVPDVDIERLTQSLRNMVAHHQTHWKYLTGLAAAWGVSEVVLRHGDFGKCATREALRDEYGFDVEAIIRRWNHNRDQQGREPR